MVLFLSVYCIYVIYRSVEAMHMLQQNLYNENNRYLRWIKKNLGRAFSVIDFIPIIFSLQKRLLLNYLYLFGQK